MTAEAHVVFGTGPAGRAGAAALLDQGARVRLPNPPTRTTRHIIVDDSAFRKAFGGHTTGWDEIVASTVDWYRTHTVNLTQSHGLAEATTEKVTS